MKLWIKVIAGTIPAAAALLFAFLLLFRWHRRRHRQLLLVSPHSSNQSSEQSSFDGITSIRLSDKPSGNSRKSLRFHHLRHPSTPQSPHGQFNWEEHPRLVAEFLEIGRPRFSVADGGAPCETADGFWEIHTDSSELMQTVRLAPGPTNAGDESPSYSWAKTSLPLPGPDLKGGSFPQEAYFEITVLNLLPGNDLLAKDGESDRAKLIRKNSPSQDRNSAAGQRGISDVTLSLGLTNRASLACQSMPGTYPGSIGFNSDGSVFLDGRKLVFESEKAGWANVNQTIGCGYDPNTKKVFFTVDANLAHVIRCSSEAYGFPLFPVLATNANATLLVNMGQAPFKYAAANAIRSPNQSFLRQLPGEVGVGETTGVIEGGEWRASGRRSREQQRKSGSKRSTAFSDDIDAESDLFEIALSS
ncbi:hypothetical protein HPP92_010145 [Vanilla planifolia]|uniref:SPRY domain-containing protein n=1 Tax=Vanilla planifolia TaxID=51239 RepID=A0A835R3J9_VANPL|nr:hypothetical protein HPP92_010365 [Vanilla planifolia]KAG0482061.1 hypothetical protein HPP92_010145 [Vanilla planifolia]